VRTLEDNTFLLLIIAVSLTFAWILWPFYGAILWGTVLATVFAPLHRRLSSSMPQRCNLAALATVLIIVTMVILPLMLIAASLLQEATGLYKRIQSGELDFGRSFQQFREALPPWATSLLDRFGLTDLRGVLERLSAGLMKGSQFLAAQALTIGQSTVDFVVSLFVMLYLLFFLLRDGDALAKRIKDAVRSALTKNMLSSASSPPSFALPSRATSLWPSCKGHLAASSSGSWVSTRRCYGPS
jgi:predicted PurR-regulated permease PerM